MAVSTEFILCPYCGVKHNKSKVLGNGGLINHNGDERSIECQRCGQEFQCIMDVTIKYKTRKS